MNTSLRELSVVVNNHGCHCILSFSSSLTISVSHYLESDANKLYDNTNKLINASLLTRCYV